MVLILNFNSGKIFLCINCCTFIKNVVNFICPKISKCIDVIYRCFYYLEEFLLKSSFKNFSMGPEPLHFLHFNFEGLHLFDRWLAVPHLRHIFIQPKFFIINSASWLWSNQLKFFWVFWFHWKKFKFLNCLFMVHSKVVTLITHNFQFQKLQEQLLFLQCHEVLQVQTEVFVL